MSLLQARKVESRMSTKDSLSLGDKIFFYFLYPLFWRQIDAILDKYRLAQVQSYEIKKNGIVLVRVNKQYRLGTLIILYKIGKPIYDGEEYLGHIEDVHAYGKVIEIAPGESVVLLTSQHKAIAPALIAKADPDEFGLETFRHFSLYRGHKFG